MQPRIYDMLQPRKIYTHNTMLRFVNFPDKPDVSAPVIGFPGGGMKINWILGTCHQLQLCAPLDACVLAGASAGAGAAAMLGCGVRVDGALEFILGDPMLRSYFENPERAAGSIEKAVRRVMEHVLPHDAAERCSGRVYIMLQRYDEGSRRWVHYFQSEFSNKEDVVNAVMASGHVPLFSSGSMYCKHRGETHVDGQWGASRERVLLEAERPRAKMRLLIDHTLDVFMPDDLNWWEIGSRQDWRRRFRAGRNHVALKAARGEVPRKHPLHGPRARGSLVPPGKRSAFGAGETHVRHTGQEDDGGAPASSSSDWDFGNAHVESMRSEAASAAERRSATRRHGESEVPNEPEINKTVKMKNRSSEMDALAKKRWSWMKQEGLTNVRMMTRDDLSKTKRGYYDDDDDILEQSMKTLRVMGSLSRLTL